MRCGAVPPTIVEEDTSSDVAVPERSKVSLRCRAEGYPPPTVTWRREEGKDINIATYASRSGSSGVTRVEGEYLNLTQVKREDMGAYLCIAANGIPPSVSKRILLQVNFKPKIRVPNQLVGIALGRPRCTWSAGWRPPRGPLTSWVRGADGLILLRNTSKFSVTEHLHSSYRTNMTLRIAHVDESDFGPYKCVAKNTLGEKEGYVRLYGGCLYI
ncbi:hypothetical protein LAZ67_16001646 [Cordylochernes scorpioides]|uniref:Ig-like domain-containing protein n=1 Tax=Cordylochernes scorpioides TaxID=51811 RepID=A0ABY6LBF7_9ARAC|nr:hypothetical protein LAZ67_16001646 [Cordylochernes scorpioides]